MQKKDLNIKVLIPILKRNDVEFAGLFGSYAKGTANKKSDVDLLVRFSKPIGLFKLVGLERKLSQTLNKKIDLVTEGFLSPYIKDDVFHDLKIFYGKR